MGQTLTHGVYLPDEGERNCYNGLAGNWTILDGAVGTIADHTTALAGKAPAVHTHTKADITDLFNSANMWTALNSYNQSIQITANFNIGAAPSSDVYGGFYFGNGKTNVGNVTARVSSAGITYSRLYVSNKYANGALDPNGTLTNVELQVGLKANGNRFIYSNASWDNSLIPYANNTYDLGSSSYQWNNVYSGTINTAVVRNTAQAASPSDSSVSSMISLINTVTYSSEDPNASARLNFRLMATGEKALYPHETNQYTLGLISRVWQNSYIQHGYFIGQLQNDEYSNNARTNLTLTANRDSAGVSGILVDSFRSNTSQGQAHHILGFEIKENSVRYSGCRMHWAYDSNADKYNFALCPTKQGNNQPASFGLGMAGYLWDTFNGINPGALSLPNLASDGYMDLSDYISVNTEYSYTPTADGWLALYVQTTGFHAENAVGIFTGGGQSNSYRWACSATSAINLPRAGRYHGAVMLPVKAGIPYLCWITIDSSTTLSSKRLYFYKATGNV